MHNIYFTKAEPQHLKTLLQWLEEPHMKEFWDNSAEHREDIIIFTEGRLRPSPYFQGLFSYWVGFINNEPYSLIMTHEENENTNPPVYMRPYLSSTGKTIGLDFCIGNPKYLGKGLAAPTLKSFMSYFQKEIDPIVDTFFIDPFLDNPRACHVYKQAGFKVQCEFTQDRGFFKNKKGVLMTKTLKNKTAIE